MRYGDVAVGIVTAGLGRHYINLILEYADVPKRRIEVDTDGVYILGDIDLDALNIYIKQYVQTYVGRENFMVVERDDPYTQAYFYKEKNYLLLDNDNKIIKHGNAFKGTTKNRLFTNALDKIALCLFLHPENLDKTIEDCFKLEHLDLAHFIMRTKIKRPLDEYSLQPGLHRTGQIGPSRLSKGCVQVQVAQQVQDKMGIDVVPGDSIEYVKQNNGYMISQFASAQMLDRKYYRSQVVRVLEILGLLKFSRHKLSDVNSRQVSLSLFIEPPQALYT